MSLAQEEKWLVFDKTAKNKFNNFFRYYKSDFKNLYTPMIFCCPEHGKFLQTPYYHLKSKYGCKKCQYQAQTKTQQQFITQCIKKYSQLFSYNKVQYIKDNIPVIITCPIHGDFTVTPSGFLLKHNQHGCNKCARESQRKKLLVSIEHFIEKTKSLCGNKNIDYNLAKYNKDHKKIKLFCTIPNHGFFWQNVNNHLHGASCPICRRSKGEKIIQSVLESNQILFKSQYRFTDCKNKNTLPFDFAILDINKNVVGLIEYQGRQHFYAIDYWGGTDHLSYVQHNDKIKETYCKENQIPLLIILDTERKIIPIKLQSFLKLII